MNVATLQAIVDSTFAFLETTFMARPVFVVVLKSLNTVVDGLLPGLASWLASHGFAITQSGQLPMTAMPSWKRAA